jgi:hypothetical protein
MKPGSADTQARRQERIQTGELRVRQIGQVGSPQGDIPAILPAKPAHSPVFRQFLVCTTCSSARACSRCIASNTASSICVKLARGCALRDPTNRLACRLPARLL